MKRSPLKRKSKSSIRKLKDKLWALTREIVFLKYGTDCYTCGAVDLSGHNLHCGHFIPSSVCTAELRYDLDNLRPQCYRCNIYLSGNWPSYETHLKRDKIDVDALKRKNKQTTVKADELFYTRKIQEYTAIYEQLQSQTR